MKKTKLRLNLTRFSLLLMCASLIITMFSMFIQCIIATVLDKVTVLQTVLTMTIWFVSSALLCIIIVDYLDPENKKKTYR